jgi:hypothetical protein
VFSFKLGVKAGPLWGEAIYSKTSFIGLLIVIDDVALAIFFMINELIIGIIYRPLI